MPTRLTVLDLTSTLGLHAIESLQPEGGAESSRRRFKLSGLGRPVGLDWLRIPSSGEVPAPPADTAGLYVIAGPGSARLLARVLEMARPMKLFDFCLLLAPNAVMEGWTLRDLARQPSAEGSAFHTLQLPFSDPQALWMILMEQFDNLLRRSSAALDPLDESDLEVKPVSSTLNQCLDAAMAIEGALAVSLVDHRSGMSLGARGSGLNLELAAAGNSEVVRAKLRTAESLGFRGGIEDILITLQQQYHLIRLTPSHPGLFLYLVLDRQRGNLALARYKLTDIERALKV